MSTNSTGAPARVLPAEFGVRTCDSGDIEALGAVYLAACPPGVACTTREEAGTDILATFSGEYGEFMPHAFPVSARGKAFVVGVLAVRRAPWPDTHDGPFVIGVFTVPDQRRRGIAPVAILTALNALRAHGEEWLALRVAASNREAIAFSTK